MENLVQEIPTNGYYDDIIKYIDYRMAIVKNSLEYVVLYEIAQMISEYGFADTESFELG